VKPGDYSVSIAASGTAKVFKDVLKIEVSD